MHANWRRGCAIFPGLSLEVIGQDVDGAWSCVPGCDAGSIGSF